MLRLILQSVDISDRTDGEREAVVVLTCDDKQYVGRGLRPAGDDDFAMVALATLDALRQYLPMPVDFRLKKAASMQHESISNNLLVVTIDYNNGSEVSMLTGTCLSDDEGAARNIAKATLDATNRLITFLLEQRENT